jgi:TamB, inner membrane protein subunit of TAM complex
LALCCISVFGLLIKYDPWCKRHIEYYIAHYICEKVAGEVHVTLKAIDPFRGVLEIETLSLSNSDKTWKLEVNGISLSIAWIFSLIRGKALLSLFVRQLLLEGDTFEGVTGFLKLLTVFMKKPSAQLPVVIQEFYLKELVCRLPLSIDIFVEDCVYRSSLSFLEGVLSVSSCKVRYCNNPFIVLQGTCIVPYGASSYPYTSNNITGKGENVCIKLEFPQVSSNERKRLCVSVDQEGSIIVQGALPIAYTSTTVDIRADCLVKLKTTLSKWKCELGGALFLKNISCNEKMLPECLCVVKNIDDKAYVKLFVKKGSSVFCDLALLWDFYKGKGFCSATNETVLSWFYDGVVPHRGISAMMLFDSCGKAKGQAHVSVTYPHRELVFEQRFDFNGTTCGLVGSCNDIDYAVTCVCDPLWRLHRASIDHKGKFFTCNGTAGDRYTVAGELSYYYIGVLCQIFGIDCLPGEGELIFSGIFNASCFKGSITTQGLNVRLPYTYNILRDVESEFSIDFNKRLLHFTDLSAVCTKGEIRCSHLRCVFDEHAQLSFAYIPLQLKHYFIEQHKALFALLSGNLIITYAAHRNASLAGHVVLENCHVSNNILSSEFQQSLIGLSVRPWAPGDIPINVDIFVKSHSPLHAKTDFLDASACINAHIEGTVAQPSLSGSLQLLHGYLKFPYKPLYITRGRLYFLPQLGDAIIELNAKNTVKQYGVNLSVSGSISKPYLSFDAYPHLEKDQIVGLLLGGSHDGTLSFVLPAFLSDSVEDLLLGPATLGSNLQASLKNLFGPLKKMRILPSVTGEGRRGGTQGTLVIELNDRLRALLQKNFKTQQETYCEIEYGWSNNTTIRLIKDDEGTIGGEIETRWKL